MPTIKRKDKADTRGTSSREKPTDGGNNFFFSDYIRKWIHGKSLQCKKSKYLF